MANRKRKVSGGCLGNRLQTLLKGLLRRDQLVVALLAGRVIPHHLAVNTDRYGACGAVVLNRSRRMKITGAQGNRTLKNRPNQPVSPVIKNMRGGGARKTWLMGTRLCFRASSIPL